MAATWNKRGQFKILCGFCPDEQCKAKLYYPSYDASIECSMCGKRYDQKDIIDVEEVTDPGVALHNILKNVLVRNFKPKKGADTVKVLGLSNYQCKLISPFMTKYGMDKQTGDAKLLKEMGQGDIFDVGILGDRAFLIEPDHIEVIGYGRDRTGSNAYLKDTLEEIKKFNGNQERLLPIHADGDGHCLVHALSKALIGRELFWHALRENLKEHFISKQKIYEQLFKDFVDKEEWSDIIKECDPEYVPNDGEPAGLRNIHVFGLANVLRRPIFLLDSLSGMQSSGDYSGVFLPGLLDASKCKGKDGKLNQPLCLAWSSNGRNHYIALVGIKGRPLPRIPSWMVPKSWALPGELMEKYIDFEKDGSCTIGGDKCLQEKYILRLVAAMEKVFEKENGVSTKLVEDVHEYLYKATGIVGIKPDLVLEETQVALKEKRLSRCLTCDAVAEMYYVEPESLKKGGALYDLAVKIHKQLYSKHEYYFKMQNIVCKYDEEKDELFIDKTKSAVKTCPICQGEEMRGIDQSGAVIYKDGDRTTTPSGKSKCQCGFKHYWKGKEYDNIPEKWPITLEWNGKFVVEEIAWFENESDDSMNSNVFKVAQEVVQKHFPGEFGSERLVQKVVDTLLRKIAQKSKDDEKEVPMEEVPPPPLSSSSSSQSHAETDSSWRRDTASKIILTGQKNKTFHKEELTKSETEKQVRKKLEKNAPLTQKRKTTELSRPHQSPPRQTTITSTTMNTTSNTAMKKSSLQDVKPKETNVSSPPISGNKTIPNEKKIKVTTSDGRQLMLSLDVETTYSQLIERLNTELELQQRNYKIKYGFPPKELNPPPPQQEMDPVPLSHGEKLTVEIKEKTVDPEPEKYAAARHSWTGFDSNASNQSADNLLLGLQELQKSSADSIDSSVASLALMSTLSGKDFWNYVQGMPHLFSVGGLFYQQVKRDIVLSDGKHCTLPTLPGKVFRYNASDDRLELCMEPHGHFQVEPGIEEKVLKQSEAKHGVAHSSRDAKMPSSLETHDVGKALAVGGSGVVVDKTMKFPTGQVPFSGTGHSLSAEPGKQEMEQLQTMIAGMQDMIEQDLKDGTETQATSAQATATPMDTVEPHSTNTSHEEVGATANKMSHFRKVGPGYTVVNEDMEDISNTLNTTSEILHNLATSIENAFEDTDMESENKEPANETTAARQATEDICDVDMEIQEHKTS